MEIICPDCNFARTVPDEKVPPTAEMATCPKCKKKFRFRNLGTPQGVQGGSGPQTKQPPEPHAPSRPQAPPTPPPGSRLPYEDEEEVPPQPRPRRQVPKAPPPPQGDVFSGLERMSDRGPGASGHEGPGGAYEEDEGEFYEEDVPWERLDAYGFFPGLTTTIKRAMLQPVRFFATMPVGQGMLRPMVFYVLLSLLSTVVTMAFNMLGITMLSSFLPQAETMPQGMEVVGMGAGALMNLILVPIFSAVFLFIWAGIMHLFLAVFQASSRGYEATFRAVAYGSAPTVLMIIPILGWVAAGPWALVVTFIGLKEIHRTSYTRVLLAFGVMLVLFFGLMFYFLHALFSAMG